MFWGVNEAVCADCLLLLFNIKTIEKRDILSFKTKKNLYFIKMGYKTSSEKLPPQKNMLVITLKNQEVKMHILTFGELFDHFSFSANSLV